MLDAHATSLVFLGNWLKDRGYRFITATPATHERVNARAPGQAAQNLRDVFGWSRAFHPSLLPAEINAALDTGGLVDAEGPLRRSKVRFSSIGPQLFAHAAYPTTDAEAVFFGPDTYRFVALIESELARRPLAAGARLLDVGCGSGAGGIAAVLATVQPAIQATALSPHPVAPQLVFTDINPRALRHARVNAVLAGVTDVGFFQGDLFQPVTGDFDLILANPPYLVDAQARTYRHGGGALGGGLSERIMAEGLPRLAAGGRLVLYTGAAMVDGTDPLWGAIHPVLQATGWPFSYRELDPDVFGEELDMPAYAEVERIAAVALVVQRPGP